MRTASSRSFQGGTGTASIVASAGASTSSAGMVNIGTAGSTASGVTAVSGTSVFLPQLQVLDVPVSVYNPARVAAQARTPTHAFDRESSSGSRPELDLETEALGLEPVVQDADLEHLHVFRQRLKTFHAATGTGSVLATGLGGRIVHWMTPVTFQDKTTESQYIRWCGGMSSAQMSSQLLLLFLLLIFVASQLTGELPITPGMWVCYVTMILFWIAAWYVMLRQPWPKDTSLHVVALLDTGIGCLIMVVSLSCSEWSTTLQCAGLERGSFNGSHFMTIFVLLLVHGFGLGLQVPWLVSHMFVVYTVWFSMMISLYPVSIADAVIVPVSTILLLLLVAAQSYDRHSTNRLQFHMVLELASQVRSNQQTQLALEAAHSEALAERTRAVRATTAREAHEAILGYTCHELRNPLHGIRASLEELKSKCALGHPIDSDDVETMQHIDTAVAQLGQVTEDVTDFNRVRAVREWLWTRVVTRADIQLQQGTLRTRPTNVDVRATLEKACHLVEHGNTRVQWKVDEDVPLTVYTDEHRLVQLLGIGLSNAVKFNRPGFTPQVRCLLVRTSEDGRALPHLQIEVWNEGEGLGAVDVSSLFEPFERTGAHGTHFRGLGLGLPISRMLVKLLGGDIGLEDRGRNTVYWFTLPLSIVESATTSALKLMETYSSNISEQQDDHAANTISNENPWLYWGRTMRMPTERPLRVLVVDDLKTNRRLLLAMLQKMGHSVKELEDGDQVLETLQDGTPVDICLLDIHMVRTDGRDVTRLLRDQGMSFPIVATTGNVSAPDVQTYREAGFDGVLGKPFTKHHLISVLTSAFSRKD